MAKKAPGNFREELESALAGRSPSDRRILFVGVLNKYLDRRVPAVLVGGAAVELYTVGGYVTSDVDLVGRRDEVEEVLKTADFSTQGRYFFRDDLGLVVEVPDRSLRPTEKVVIVEFEGYEVPVVRPEDAIVDRLLAAKFWKSQTDWEQAILLWTAQSGTIDLKALEASAKENDVEDFLERLKKLKT